MPLAALAQGLNKNVTSSLAEITGLSGKNLIPSLDAFGGIGAQVNRCS